MKLNRLIACILTILLSSSFLVAQKSNSRIEVLDNAAFDAKLLHIKGSLIDLRSSDEVKSGLLPNAKVIDWEGESFKKSVSQLPHNQPVFLYCAGGFRSKEAAKWMQNDGFTTIIILKDGFDLWLSEGYTVVDLNGKVIQQKKSVREKSPASTYE